MGESYTITGTSSDTGGSSVRRVEVSLDGGSTWNEAIGVAAVGTGFTWQHVWTSPALGSYTIRTRATDWFGNMETPGAGVTVGVLTTLPTVTIEIEGPPATPVTPATPAPTLTTPTLPHPAPTTVVEMRANLAVLQTHLLSLLQQLLASLQAQLQSLGR